MIIYGGVFATTFGTAVLILLFFYGVRRLADLAEKLKSLWLLGVAMLLAFAGLLFISYLVVV